MATRAKPVSPAEILEAIEALGGAMASTAAARELGILPPNFKRDAAPKLTPLPVEGSAAVYFRSEVEELAAQLRERRARGNGHAASKAEPAVVANVRSSAQARGHVAPIPKAAG